MADKTSYREGDDRYEAQNDDAGGVSGDLHDDSYASRTGQSHIPVQKDSDPVGGGIDSAEANSDEQLARDENEAINKENIIGGRTRGAKPAGSYSEGPDEDDLPAAAATGAAGTSSTS